MARESSVKWCSFATVYPTNDMQVVGGKIRKVRGSIIYSKTLAPSYRRV
jgi:hypothetical protein